MDWLLVDAGAQPTLAGIREALKHWPGGELATNSETKRMFSDKLLVSAIERLKNLSHN